jgi:capsular polysaccharide biosynthesis protein
MYKSQDQQLRIAKIDGACVTDKGVILFGDNNVAANGGKHDKSREPFVLSRAHIEQIKQKAIFYESIISVACAWQPYTWHFIIEVLPGILLSKKFMKYADCKIHLGRTNSIVEQWLRLVGIDVNRVITGDINCKNLFVPELAMYGTRHKLHLELLKENLECFTKKQSYIDLLIYIKRTKSRQFTNSDEIESWLQMYAKANNLVYYIHDDSCLPSVKDQLEMFSNAKVVVAQHGAGSINMVVAKPNAVLIELFDESYVNYCCKPIIQALRQRYVDIVGSSYSIAVTKIEKALNTRLECPTV